MQSSLIIKPVMTEKAARMNQSGKYVFLVRKEANKIEIRKLIEELYQVKVGKMNVIQVPSKMRVAGKKGPSLKRHAMKKIVVSLRDKKTIDVYKPKASISKK